ncbi:MAG: FG-GAP-like repeat-containing protein [Acidobacteriia bacterium]|nr:FG-GAP-like repeat-containing protein [Terriglobia bacterium]
MNYSKFRPALLPLVLFGVLGLLSAPALAQTYAFNAASFATGHNPQVVVNADLNGDGRPDLVIANFNDNTISVLIGNPDGSYQPHVDYAVGTNPVAITVADFNGDGKMDLAVVNNNCPTTPCAAVGSVSVLLNNGDGTFQSHVDKNVGNSPYGVVADDFDGNGKQDLIVTNSQDNTVSVLSGNGDGTFKLLRKLTTGASPHGIMKGDFNRDHLDDVLIANTGESDLTLFRGNGDLTFQKALLFTTGPNPLNITGGDFNGDGRVDVVTTNSTASTVSVLMAVLRGGLFSTHVDLTIAGTAVGVATGDFSGDGFDDIAATTAGIDGVSVLLSNGDGTFKPHVDFAAGVDPVSATAGDFNGDGKIDLATANDLDNSVTIFPGKGTGGFQSLFGTPVGVMPDGLDTADFNGDHFQDLAVADRSDNKILILLSNGDGTFATASNPVLTGNKPSSVTAVDLNEDNIPDLVATNSSDNTITVALGNGDGSFQAPKTFTVATKPVAVAWGDFNNDTHRDLVVVNQITMSVSILLGDGKGNFSAAQGFTTGAGTSPTAVAVGDFVGNGKQDLAVACSGTGTVAVLLGVGDGTFTLPVQYTAGTGPSGVAAADFSGDGKIDLAVSNATSANVSILLGVGNGTFQTHVDYPVGKNPFSVVAADLNGDGKKDLAIGSSNSSINRIGVMLGNGDGTFQPPTYHATKLNFGGPSEAVAVGDFNNDGALDVAAADQVANSVSVYLNSPLPSMFPGSLDFGSEAIGMPSPPQTVTLYNSGSAVLSSMLPSISGDFSQSSACGSSLDVGANCATQVTFTPLDGGTRTGDLTFTDNGLGTAQNAALTGTGTGPGAILSVNSLTFPTTAVGTTSSRQTVTLTNTGTQTLNITSIVISGNFTLNTSCGTTLGAGKVCNIGLSFKPLTSGTLTGAVTITDDASGSPQTISLTGVGTFVKLLPTALNFGSQAVGTTSTSQTVTLTNVGSVKLNITDISIVGTNAGDFVLQSNTCGSSVGSHKSCTLTVAFAPTATGSRSADIQITDDGGGSPQLVPLGGNGT